MIKFTTFTCLLVTVAICSSQKISVPVQYLQCNGASQPEPSDELRGIPGQRGDKGELVRSFQLFLFHNTRDS